jgi:KDO2-lipid IV(A) lauroyltransferase
MGNLRRVFGSVLPETELRQIAQAYYAHFIRFLIEIVRLPFMSARRREVWVRVENMESPIRAHEKGKGLLLLTGHFGNWEAATVAGLHQYPKYRNLFHFVRRPLKPRWLNDFVTWRFKRAGFGSIAKRGSLESILESAS